jgi:hypothetical protein
MNALFGREPRRVAAEVPADTEILDHLPAVTTLSKE